MLSSKMGGLYRVCGLLMAAAYWNSAAAASGPIHAVSPQITAIAPDVVYGFDGPQPLTVYGSNLSPGAEIVLRKRTVSRQLTMPADREFRKRPALMRGKGRIIMAPSFGTDAGLWTIEIINPDGKRSGEFGFMVHKPLPMPWSDSNGANSWPGQTWPGSNKPAADHMPRM